MEVVEVVVRVGGRCCWAIWAPSDRAQKRDPIAYLDIHGAAIVSKVAVHVHCVKYGALRGADLHRAALARRGRVDDAQVVRLKDTARPDIE